MGSAWLMAACASAAIVSSASAQPPASNASVEIYGAAMLDIGHDFRQIDPQWFDTMRVSRLPSAPDQFGRGNRTFAGVRQSRIGVRTAAPTALGSLTTLFEFELFGTGVDAGQTTFRLRHFYGELGAFGAGQTWSPFVDPDVIPNTLDHWGATGMAAFRNVQVRWIPLHGAHSLTFAVERPGASGDDGIYADRVELQNIQARFPLPDLSGSYKVTRSWGYVRAAGVVRQIKWDDLLDDAFELSGGATGWGVNLSSNLKVGARDTLRIGVVVGEGVENYMGDAPVDIGIVNNFGDPLTPIVGAALPITGLLVFLDHTWSAKFSSTAGYSRTDIDNTSGQAADAYRAGQYATGNLLYRPVANAMVGGELQWGRRQNFSDGFQSDGLKLHFSFKYSFSHEFRRQ